jgi:hypothetical protein
MAVLLAELLLLHVLGLRRGLVLNLSLLQLLPAQNWLLNSKLLPSRIVCPFPQQGGLLHLWVLSREERVVSQ